ncbi:MAG: potassium transporter Kef [Deltaproteobacteria bacterium RBG_13_58_19]|nr:MAG: potassium transporter Kef [Deltaproteobacteria bacterium RBG_13_58_19]
MWFTLTAWIALALLASLISIRIGISVALVEIFLGFIAGNCGAYFGSTVFQPNAWINFLAGFASVVLTFLAGAEIEPEAFRRQLKPTLAIGFVSFLFPFLGAMAYAYYVGGWNLQAAQIAGIALSTTSMAVVYAVMVETGLNETELGKLILAACFVTDLGTVLALGLIFAQYDYWLLIFVGVTVIALWRLRAMSRWVFARWGGRVSEPEIKFIFLVLSILGALAVTARSEAVLPAYLFGMVVAGLFAQDKVLIFRMRSIVFALLTPFFFIKAGTLVSLPALIAGFGLLVILFGVKMATKIIGVWPLCRVFKIPLRESNYTTLLMATGLTFGSISALFGLTYGYIDQAQYSILVTVVIASAVIPTVIAQIWFQPREVGLGREEDFAYIGTAEHFLHTSED